MTQLKRTQSIANRFLPRLVYRFHLLAILFVLFGSVCPAAIAQNQLKPSSNQLNLSQGQTTPVPNPSGISPTPSKPNDPLAIEKEKLRLEQEKVKLEREKIQLEIQRFQLEQKQHQNRRIWGVAGPLGTSGAIAGTLATIIGGIFVYLNYRVAQDKQLTERFSKAVELLGAETQIQVRIGAVYALKKLAEDSPKAYQKLVADVLAGFVRERSRQDDLQQKEDQLIARSSSIFLYEGSRADKVTPTDIQSALKAINELATSINKSVEYDAPNYYITDLSKSNLEHAWLNGFKLTRAWLWYTNLYDGYLAEAELQWADLWGAVLTKADFRDAKLQNARLGEAILDKARLERANLSNANLKNTIFLQTNLKGCKNLKREQLERENPPFLCDVTLPDSVEGYSSDELNMLANRDCTNPAFHEALSKSKNSLENVEKAEEYIRTEVVGVERYEKLKQDNSRTSFK